MLSCVYHRGAADTEGRTDHTEGNSPMAHFLHQRRTQNWLHCTCPRPHTRAPWPHWPCHHPTCATHAHGLSDWQCEVRSHWPVDISKAPSGNYRLKVWLIYTPLPGFESSLAALHTILRTRYVQNWPRCNGPAGLGVEKRVNKLAEYNSTTYPLLAIWWRDTPIMSIHVCT